MNPRIWISECFQIHEKTYYLQLNHGLDPLLQHTRLLREFLQPLVKPHWTPSRLKHSWILDYFTDCPQYVHLNCMSDTIVWSRGAPQGTVHHRGYFLSVAIEVFKSYPSVSMTVIVIIFCIIFTSLLSISLHSTLDYCWHISSYFSYCFNRIWKRCVAARCCLSLDLD